MKNVLIISSSPRKNGNTNALSEQFKKGAEANDNFISIEVQWLTPHMSWQYGMNCSASAGSFCFSDLVEVVQ